MSTLSIPGVEIAEVLGAGAFGTVYHGRHRFLDVDVAVKLIEQASVGTAHRAQRDPACFVLERCRSREELSARRIHVVRVQSPDVTAATAALLSQLLDDAPDRRPTAETALARIDPLLSRLTAS